MNEIVMTSSASHQVFWVGSVTQPDKRLALRWWRNAQRNERPTRGFVWVSHGLGEHGGRYQDLALYLSQLGMDVIALDHPGHGLTRTEGKFTAICGFDVMVRELNNAYAFWVEKGPLSQQRPNQSPWFLLGHSMGALVGLNWILKAKTLGNFPFEFAQRAFLSAPPLGLRLPVPAIKRRMAEGVVRFFPQIKLSNEIDPAMLSYDAANVARYKTDPLVHDRVSPENFISMLETQVEVLARPQDIEIPVCLAVGRDDPIVSPEVIEKYFQSLGTHKKLLMIDHAKHEILNETNKRALYEQIALWFV